MPTRTRAEFVGVGPFWSGEHDPEGATAYPKIFRKGAPMGQHLSVERLVRIGDRRMVYLVDNLSRKWSRRKCWACGNKHTPNRAQSCDYCGQKLEDLRFLLTARWNEPDFAKFEAFARRRLRHFGVVPPVYAFYRQGMLMALYHYDDSGFLHDVASPVGTTAVLHTTAQLCESLSWLHQQGVALGPFSSLNVLLMPDGSARWFDFDIATMADGPAALYRDPERPALKNVQNLASMMLRFIDPAESSVRGLFARAVEGGFSAVTPFSQQVRRMLILRRQEIEPAHSTPVAAMSDLGLYRGENQDAWGWRRVNDDALLYVVADGMGGHADGALAARMAVDRALDSVQSTLGKSSKAGSIPPAMLGAVHAANDAVFRYRTRHTQQMGCTLTMLLVLKGRGLYIAHAGDSRAYLYRGRKLEQLTRDHTVANALVDDGQITPEQALSHKARHILVSAIGAEEELDTVQQLYLDGKPGDRLLLCSDGLSGEVEDAMIAGHLKAWADRQKAVRELVREAYGNGARDNVTALVVDVE